MTKDFNRLKTRQRSIRDSFSPDFGLRVHRAISWVGRAEREVHDPDAAFLFYWIAFNSAYAADQDFLGEKTAFRGFLQKLADVDGEGQIYDAVWTRFSGSIRLFLENRFVFGPFWHCQNGVDGFENWEERFSNSKAVFGRALTSTDTVTIMAMLFDRLYVLRNQIIHGGSTWGSSVNRGQIRDGAAILSFLVPVFLELMMNNYNDDWGKPFYPVIDA